MNKYLKNHCMALAAACVFLFGFACHASAQISPVDSALRQRLSGMNLAGATTGFLYDAAYSLDDIARYSDAPDTNTTWEGWEEVSSAISRMQLGALTLQSELGAFDSLAKALHDQWNALPIAIMV